MRTIRFTALLLLLFVVAMTGNGAVLDNFSSPDGWKKGRNHTGEFTCSAETGMTLEHKPGGPGWISVTKTFEVDLDQNPEFMLKVKSATGSCEESGRSTNSAPLDTRPMADFLLPSDDFKIINSLGK